MTYRSWSIRKAAGSPASRRPHGPPARRWRQSPDCPTRSLSAMPWAMTAHIVYLAIDAAAPATFSRPVIDSAIRGDIGFDGVLISDDISMGALAGTLAERTRRALAAGCDLVLHCSGIIA